MADGGERYTGAASMSGRAEWREWRGALGEHSGGSERVGRPDSDGQGERERRSNANGEWKNRLRQTRPLCTTLKRQLTATGGTLGRDEARQSWQSMAECTPLRSVSTGRRALRSACTALPQVRLLDVRHAFFPRRQCRVRRGLASARTLPLSRQALRMFSPVRFSAFVLRENILCVEGLIFKLNTDSVSNPL